jgi:WD40 repeat protein
VAHFAFSRDGKQLAAAMSYSGAITVWDVASRSLIPNAAHPITFELTTFSSDGKALAFAWPGLPHVDWRSGKVNHRLADVAADPRSWDLPSLSPDHKLYAVSDENGSIRLLDAATGNLLRTLVGLKKGYHRVAFSRDGRRLAAVDSVNMIRVWDVNSGREITTLSASDKAFSNLLLSGDGRILAGVQRHVVYTWSVNDKIQLARIDGPDSPALSPDGHLLAGVHVPLSPKGAIDRAQASGENDIGIWDTSSGRLLKSLPGHSVDSRSGRCWCDFSPNGQWLVTGDASGKVRLWEVLSGQEMYRFEGHRTRILSGDISQDGRFLLTPSNDAPCFIWDIFGTEKPPQGAANLEQLWHDLADPDAKKAFLAIRELVVRPGPAVDLIRKSLKADALENATETNSQRLLGSRAVGVLEIIATSDAAKLLHDLAARSKNTALTSEASAAAERLRARGAK